MATLSRIMEEWALMSSTDRRGNIIYASDQFCQTTGYASHELVGQSHRILSSGIHSKSFFQNLWQTIAQGHSWHGEICNRAKSGELQWFDTFIMPEKDAHGGIVSFHALRTKIESPKKPHKGHHSFYQQQLEAISRAQQEFISEESPKIAFDRLLEDLLRLTSSEYGFIGEVLYDNGEPYLKTYAITNIAWDKETHDFYNAHAPKGMEFRNLKTLFGQALVTKQPVISNSPSTDPRRGGLPAGHPRMDSFLGIPFLAGDALIGMMGIANRPYGYDDAFIEDIQPILNTIGGLLEARKDHVARKNAEQALRESEARWQFALEGSGDGIWDWNAQTNKVFFSQQWKAMLGYDAEDMGDTLDEWSSRVHPDDIEKCYQAIQAHFEKRSPLYINEHRMKCKDGSYKWVLDRGQVIERDGEGKALRVIGTHSDIDERKRQEEWLKQLNAQLSEEKTKVEEAYLSLQDAQSQLLQAEKMASLGLLTAGIAHEINNPMTFVSGGIDALQENLQDIVSLLQVYELQRKDGGQPWHHERIERLHDALGNAETIGQDVANLFNAIRDGIARVNEIVKGLRIFSRLDKDTFQKANLHEIINSALVILHSAYRHRIQIHQQYAENMPPIDCYAGQLGQVFMNIIANAIDAMENGGEMRISTKLEGDKAIIVIADNGEGIPPHILQHVFDPFFTTKPVGRGTGLGLAISYSIIEKHNGKIKVSSELGKGTQFVISIPISHNSR